VRDTLSVRSCVLGSCIMEQVVKWQQCSLTPKNYSLAEIVAGCDPNAWSHYLHAKLACKINNLLLLRQVLHFECRQTVTCIQHSIHSGLHSATENHFLLECMHLYFEQYL